MCVGNTAHSQFPLDAVLALLAGFGAVAGELLGVAFVVELAVFFQAREHDADEQFVAGAAREFLLHLLHRVCAPRERAECDVVKLFFGFELSRA